MKQLQVFFDLVIQLANVISMGKITHYLEILPKVLRLGYMFILTLCGCIKCLCCYAKFGVLRFSGNLHLAIP